MKMDGAEPYMIRKLAENKGLKLDSKEFNSALKYNYLSEKLIKKRYNKEESFDIIWKLLIYQLLSGNCKSTPIKDTVLIEILLNKFKHLNKTDHCHQYALLLQILSRMIACMSDDYKKKLMGEELQFYMLTYAAFVLNGSNHKDLYEKVANADKLSGYLIHFQKGINDINCENFDQEKYFKNMKLLSEDYRMLKYIYDLDKMRSCMETALTKTSYKLADKEINNLCITRTTQIIKRLLYNKDLSNKLRSSLFQNDQNNLVDLHNIKNVRECLNKISNLFNDLKEHFSKNLPIGLYFDGDKFTSEEQLIIKEAEVSTIFNSNNITNIISNIKSAIKKKFKVKNVFNTKQQFDEESKDIGEFIRKLICCIRDQISTNNRSLHSNVPNIVTSAVKKEVHIVFNKYQATLVNIMSPKSDPFKLASDPKMLSALEAVLVNLLTCLKYLHNFKEDPLFLIGKTPLYTDDNLLRYLTNPDDILADVLPCHPKISVVFYATKLRDKDANFCIMEKTYVERKYPIPAARKNFERLLGETLDTNELIEKENERVESEVEAEMSTQMYPDNKLNTISLFFSHEEKVEAETQICLYNKQNAIKFLEMLKMNYCVPENMNFLLDSSNG
ncbi:uncharacterized protein LOC115877458 [Sitophilus oryzae]|uniref:Uncharacterized protein LOC115877458 n=1 Tax=Sitophilus oryzae TaxID=7048 RepID=A0A6J2XDZ1_SITOR|nr:uncharacterized protein LOC115877458 [Sitophilus oryzae]XP_030749472.1 uncharacterized protein LOC115877458 [Sitophilus oryzae]